MFGPTKMIEEPIMARWPWTLSHVF